MSHATTPFIYGRREHLAQVGSDLRSIDKTEQGQDRTGIRQRGSVETDQDDSSIDFACGQVAVYFGTQGNEQ